MPIPVKRTATILNPDQSRVLLRPFIPGNSQRVSAIVDRILALPADEVKLLLDEICLEFSERHQEIRKTFLQRYEQVREYLWADAGVGVTEQQRLLIGSYFLAEYSLESSALFNPSIVAHPDQSGLAPGELRFILSLRATAKVISHRSPFAQA